MRKRISKSIFFIFSILFFSIFNFQILNAQIVGTLVGLKYLGNGKPAAQVVLQQPLGLSVDKFIENYLNIEKNIRLEFISNENRNYIPNYYINCIINRVI